MSTYTSFAVVGAGGIGKHITEALVATGVSVIILTRSGSSSKSQVAGVKAVPVDYTDVPALTAILKEHKVEVIVSTVGNPGLDSQRQIAQAGKAAGARLFVPSEYGLPSEGHTGGLLGQKDAFTKYLESIDLAWARFYVGFFTELIPNITGLVANGKINIAGKGGAPCSWTSESDIAGFIAHVLTAKPPATLANKSFRLQGDRATLEEIAALFKVDVAYVDAVPGEGSDVTTYLQGYLDKGYGSTGFDVTINAEGREPAGSTNGLWEGHHWKTIKDVHKLS